MLYSIINSLWLLLLLQSHRHHLSPCKRRRPSDLQCRRCCPVGCQGTTVHGLQTGTPSVPVGQQRTTSHNQVCKHSGRLGDYRHPRPASSKLTCRSAPHQHNNPHKSADMPLLLTPKQAQQLLLLSSVVTLKFQVVRVWPLIVRNMFWGCRCMKEEIWLRCSWVLQPHSCMVITCSHCTQRHQG